VKKIVLLFCIMFDLSAMEVDEEKAETGVISLDQYYDHDTKTLNMRNLMLGDTGLKKRLKDIKQFIDLVRAESLILEKNNLQQIPYNVITFALINRSLKYVSLKENKFNLPVFLGDEDADELSMPLDLLDGAKVKKLPEQFRDAILKNSGETKSSMMSTIAASLWEGLSPEIEKALTEHNSSQIKKILYKKIIIIDKNLPPITVIDNKRLPKSKMSTLKNISVKFLMILIGVTITLLPQIVEWVSPSDDNTPSNSTADPLATSFSAMQL